MWVGLWWIACSFNPDGDESPADTAAPLPEELPWERLVGEPPPEQVDLPEFQAVDASGEARTWAHLYGHRSLLWFWDGAAPEGACGAPCAWEGVREALAAGEVSIVGVSNRPPAELAAALAAHPVGFELWYDADGLVSSTYGATGALGGAPLAKAVLLSDRGRWWVDYPAPASPDTVAADVAVLWGP